LFLKVNNFHNIFVIDDEKIARMSTIRIIENASLSLKINLNIFEAEDGIETIFIFYKLIKQGIKISMIFSDETMQYMKGVRTYKIIKEILEDKNLQMIPFFLVTALSDMTFEDSELKILSKPLKEEMVVPLFLKLKI
jgi:response regulator RpfG family c-di-GMP phosphodiesterase